MPDALPLPPLTDHTQALEWLARDPVLGGMLATLPPLPVLSPTPDPFGTLVRSVVGQQLSLNLSRLKSRDSRFSERCQPKLVLHTLHERFGCPTSQRPPSS